jgi:hypothetical protein
MYGKSGFPDFLSAQSQLALYAEQHDSPPALLEVGALSCSEPLSARVRMASCGGGES